MADTDRVVTVNATTKLPPASVLEAWDGRWLGGDAVGRTRYDTAGESLAAKLDMGTGDIVLNVVGDSTGDESTEWFRLWVNEIAAAYPKLRVEYTRWNTANAYDAMTVVQKGDGYVPAGPQVTVSDNFNRTASSLIGTSPQIGGAWTGTSTAWSLNGSAAVAGEPVGDAVSNGGKVGDGTAVATGVSLNTASGGSTARQVRLYGKYISPATSLYAYVNVATSGNVSAGIVKRSGGSNTVLVLSGALGLTANAVNTFNMSLTTTGTSVSATINGVTTNFTLSQADADLFAPSTTAGIGTAGGPADVGTTVDSFTYTIAAATTPIGQKLTAYNGSIGGSILSAQQAQLQTMLPVRPDVVFISSSHNYFDMQPSTYVTTLTDFIASLRARWSDVPVALSSQNPRYDPAPYARDHLARLVQLRIFALRNGYGYIPVTEAYRAKSDGGRSLVNADGIHPNAAGSELWRSVVSHYLTSKSLKPSS